MLELDKYTRKLAAILFTDMVGYTAVMQRDEILAIKMQKRHQYVVDTCVQQFGGEVKNDMGDGSMSVLPSAIQVIQCAMAIQQELKKEPVVNIRVGIHIADVLIEESGKVHGDGINIASRIETLGVAGAILFSKEIYNKIKNHPEFKTVLVGSFPFKNVEEPMEVYAIANEGFAIPSAQEALSTGKLKKSNTTQPAEKGQKPISKAWWLAAPIVLLLAILLFKWVQQPTSASKLSLPPETSPAVENKQHWTGKVAHFDSRPASGVILDINGGVYKDTTDATGHFDLYLPSMYANERVTLTLFYEGKMNLSREIRLSEEVLQSLKLEPK
ncbi:MAG: adenylate/guanylate cyclase domain-containing protein [Saprospiraceae bacterium]|jgi:class 3 adenylate cyclase|nr:adenylate/guanylate cyclase domain-containing protein [Saprospiraceae bacterium]MBK6817802.1 adenylate/guanylate cyclase domain-containing protein [Saprospiraceae bacterium]MBK7373180.1 adenylate/guanylate cyclase domain-containing protein [Saprospiraceae bacterium]MBK8280416.1 adenylate/guanylate cyclase domain-containing protein [Saprospiraceae bacterium]MBK8513125.1 adenylate/guanylate cyclase domain-containing protein [Saprospiraceae bacterium]